MYELLRLYPELSGAPPAYGWATPVSTFHDGGVCVGAHRNFPRQLFGLGTGHDPVRAYLASCILMRHITGTSSKADAMFGFQRGA